MLLIIFKTSKKNFFASQSSIMLKYQNRTVTKNRDVYQTVENCTDASIVATVIFHNANCPEDGGFVVVSTCASCLKVS